MLLSLSEGKSYVTLWVFLFLRNGELKRGDQLLAVNGVVRKPRRQLTDCSLCLSVCLSVFFFFSFLPRSFIEMRVPIDMAFFFLLEMYDFVAKCAQDALAY